MPTEQVIWRVGKSPQRLIECALDSESELENMIFKDVSILNDQWLLIGRQVRTAYDKFIDLLAVDELGTLIIIELKKHKTPREVVAQIIDYASWVQDIDASTIAEIFEKFNRDYPSASTSLDQAFFDEFGCKLAEVDLNSAHQMVIVAAELDSSTERIVKYMSNYNVPLNAVFFRVFRDGETRYLSRAWFIDPAVTQEHATTPIGTAPWNGEYYVSFGHGAERKWDEAHMYGFISGGGGRWHSRTLNKLNKGDRVWVNIPKTGYVGVGIVESPAVKVDEFMVQTEDGEKSLIEVSSTAGYHKQWIDDEDKAEYVVRIEWLKHVPINEAVSEVGFFGNQNTVCKPTTPKWNHTIERLESLWGIDKS